MPGPEWGLLGCGMREDITCALVGKLVDRSHASPPGDSRLGAGGRRPFEV
jgi:hypothetical protein